MAYAPMDSYVFLWTPRGLSMDSSHGFLWIPIGFLLIPIEPLWILVGFPWILAGFLWIPMEFPWIPLGFYVFLCIPTDSY